MELSVALETTVFNQSAQKHYTINPLTQPCYTRNFIKIDILVLEIFKVESVDAVWRATDDGPSLYYKFMWADGLGEQKFALWWNMGIRYTAATRHLTPAAV